MQFKKDSRNFISEKVSGKLVFTFSSEEVGKCHESQDAFVLASIISKIVVTV